MRLINGSRCFTFVPFFFFFFLPFTVETKVAKRMSFVQGIRIREATVLERNEYLILMTLTRKNEGGKGKEEEWKVTKNNKGVTKLHQ